MKILLLLFILLRVVEASDQQLSEWFVSSKKIIPIQYNQLYDLKNPITPICYQNYYMCIRNTLAPGINFSHGTVSIKEKDNKTFLYAIFYYKKDHPYLVSRNVVPQAIISQQYPYQRNGELFYAASKNGEWHASSLKLEIPADIDYVKDIPGSYLLSSYDNTANVTCSISPESIGFNIRTIYSYLRDGKSLKKFLDNLRPMTYEEMLQEYGQETADSWK